MPILCLMESISLQKVIEIMDGKQPFSIAFVTADSKKDSGGEWIYIPKAWKHEFATRKEIAAAQNAAPRSDMVRKNPNHYQNSTRNLRLPNGEIRKVHVRLITQFNNQIVT